MELFSEIEVPSWLEGIFGDVESMCHNQSLDWKNFRSQEDLRWVLDQLLEFHCDFWSKSTGWRWWVKWRGSWRSDLKFSLSLIGWSEVGGPFCHAEFWKWISINFSKKHPNIWKGMMDFSFFLFRKKTFFYRWQRKCRLAKSLLFQNSTKC